MRRFLAAVVAAPLLLTGCVAASDADGTPSGADPRAPQADTWVYQLTNYPNGSLDAIAEAPQDLAVIDLSSDGGEDYFTAEEIAALRDSGKSALAYFSIGTIETYRPEYPDVAETDMVLNQWGDWPEENFVAYWSDEWWDLTVRPRLDAALDAGFDGVYLDVPNAYEEIDLDLVPDMDREDLAREMVDLIARISEHAKAENPNFWIFPQNAPELREYDGYMEAVDGLGVEDLYFRAADEPCVEEFCPENLDHTRALHEAGKLILAVDYADEADNIAHACAQYAREGFAGYVSVVELDRVSPPCA